MNANDQPPEPDKTVLTPGFLNRLALGVVLPLYILAAWAIYRIGGAQPVAAEANRFTYYAVFCAMGLACAVGSTWLRVYLSNRRRHEDEANDQKPLLLSLAMSETPALLGLIYFIMFRDWLGFSFLVLATFIAFAYHALSRVSEER